MTERETGSISSVLMASLAALVLVGYYVANVSSQNQNAMAKYKADANSEAAYLSNLSALSLAKAALNPALVPGSTDRWEPTVFPLDYFHDWTLEINDQKPGAVESTSGRLIVKSFGSSPLAISDAVKVFGATQSGSAIAMKQVKTFKIVRPVRSKVYPEYVESIIISTKNDEVTAAGSASTNKLETFAKIPLLAPEPGPIVLEIENSAGVWSTNYGTAAAPLQPGPYRLRIKGSGIIYYGVITGPLGEKYVLGLQDGSVIHKAVNIRASDIVIGMTPMLQLGVKGEDIAAALPPPAPEPTAPAAAPPPASGYKVSMLSAPQCTFIITPNTTPSSPSTPAPASPTTPAPATPVTPVVPVVTTVATGVAAPLDISVKIYRVDGIESPRSFNQTFYFEKYDTVTALPVATAPSPSTPVATQPSPTTPGGSCSEMCPTTREVSVSGENVISTMTKSNAGGTDYPNFESARGGGNQTLLDQTGYKATLCSNFQSMADAIAADVGVSSWSQISGSTWNSVSADLNPNRSPSFWELETFVVYVAPECLRNVVDTRDGCGCFDKDTLIRMADGRDVTASEIRRGDFLWNPKTLKPQRVKRVVAGPEKDPLIALKINEILLKVTSEHPFLTPEGMKAAKNLKLGDQVISKGENLRVQMITLQETALGEDFPVVWNFELEGGADESDHFILANGVMTGDLFLQQQLQNLGSSSIETKSELQ